jgi:hypothetical protein
MSLLECCPDIRGRANFAGKAAAMLDNKTGKPNRGDEVAAIVQ